MNQLKPNTDPLSSIKMPIFKWRSWYWWFAVLANFSTIIFLVIYMVIMDRLPMSWVKNSFLYPIYIAISALIILAFLAFYFFLAYKDLKINKKIIKAKRMKFLHYGMFFNFGSQIFYFLAVIASYNVYRNEIFVNENFSARSTIFPGNVSITGFLGIMLGIVALLLMIGFVLWTFYQFSFAFDLYVFRNQEIILQYQKERSKKNQKKFFQSEHNWEEMAKKHKNAHLKSGINRWTNYADIYEKEINKVN